MRIDELFQKYYRYSRLDDDHYMFDTDQGLRYLVGFAELNIPVDWQNRKVIATGFVIVKGDDDVSDLIQHTGDAFTVFSTVGEIIREYMSKTHYEYFAVGGNISEPSRLKLYETFIKFLPKFLPGWEYHSSSNTIVENSKVWIFKRKGSKS